MSEAVRGFILQPTYRVESGRPVVQLYGRLEDGRTFLVRDRRQVPRFYVETARRERAPRPRGGAPRDHRQGHPGRPTRWLRVEVAVPADAPPLRERLRRGGIACHEADVRFAIRYLIDRRIRGAVEIHGEGRARCRGCVAVVFDEPDARARPTGRRRLSVLSFDIETDPEARAPAVDRPPRVRRRRRSCC